MLLQPLLDLLFNLLLDLARIIDSFFRVDVHHVREFDFRGRGLHQAELDFILEIFLLLDFLLSLHFLSLVLCKVERNNYARLLLGGLLEGQGMFHEVVDFVLVVELVVNHDLLKGGNVALQRADVVLQVLALHLLFSFHLHLGGVLKQVRLTADIKQAHVPPLDVGNRVMVLDLHGHPFHARRNISLVHDALLLSGFSLCLRLFSALRGRGLLLRLGQGGVRRRGCGFALRIADLLPEFAVLLLNAAWLDEVESMYLTLFSLFGAGHADIRIKDAHNLPLALHHSDQLLDFVFLFQHLVYLGGFLVGLQFHNISFLVADFALLIHNQLLVLHLEVFILLLLIFGLRGEINSFLL